MYRIIDKRGVGKTAHLMQIAKENNAVFVCGNPHAMEQKALAYGITGLTFMSYEEFIRTRGLKRKFVIDEIELFTHYITIPNEFMGYTLSNED